MQYTVIWASLWENLPSEFPTRSHTRRAVQPQKMARGLKFGIKKVEELYYLCSKNKGADQLHGYCEADLRLCFGICKKPVFSQGGSFYGCKKRHFTNEKLWQFFLFLLKTQILGKY